MNLLYFNWNEPSWVSHFGFQPKISPLHSFLALVSETVRERAFARIYLKTLAVSGGENYQTWDNMSGNEVNADKYFGAFASVQYSNQEIGEIVKFLRIKHI